METHCIYELEGVRCTTQDGQIISRKVKFHILEANDYNGKNFIVKAMDESDPRFLYHDRLNAMKFQNVAQDLELNFEFDKFGDYVQDLLRSVPNNPHRFCELNAEDVPHLIIKDSSDQWKTNTLLKLPLQQAEDDALMTHMVDLCTERKKYNEDLTDENECLQMKLQKAIENCEGLKANLRDLQTETERSLEKLRHEHALQVSDINRSHEAMHRDLLEQSQRKQDEFRHELSQTQNTLKTTEKSLEEFKAENSSLQLQIEEIKVELQSEGKRSSDLSQRNETLHTQLKDLQIVREDLEKQVERLKLQKKELDHFKHQSRTIENELTNEKMRLQHANECFLRETSQLKADLENHKEYKRTSISQAAEIERLKKEQDQAAQELSELRKKYEKQQQEGREHEIEYMKLRTEFEFLSKEREKLKDDYAKQQQTLDEFLKQQQYPYPSVNAFLPPTPKLYSTPSAFGSESSFRLDTGYVGDPAKSLFDAKPAFTSSAPNLPTIDITPKLDQFELKRSASPASFSWMREFGT